MGFFDLNIPYDEHSSSSSSSSSSSRNRIRIVAKLMELGYSGIAYNRTVKGVMSDRDRCSIPLLNVSSLHSILPSFSASVEFHRDLLGVPRSSRFRQYTRLTISVNSLHEVMAVNSDNLILKTYDLIAVKPHNQYSFEQACEKLEIDIIAIDFAEKLPFSLKQGTIKSAIQRGVYFEIMYSDLLSDVHDRRQTISAAKILVDWTKGKNLILSSAAPSVNEIRGPYDVANLSSLLGVSMECAKAAVSKNSRNLIANALKRKQFYKETIPVERISSDDKLDLNDPLSADLFKWDPISGGAGDFLLDDIAKSFAASNEKLGGVKAIDFNSVIDDVPPQGFLVKNVISGSKAKLLSNEKGKSIVEEIAQPKTSKLEEPIEMDIDNVQLKNPLPSSVLSAVSANELLNSPTSTRDVSAVVFGNDRKEISKMEAVDSHQYEYGLKSSDILTGSENILRDKTSTNLVSEDQKNVIMDGTFTAEECLLDARLGKPGDVAMADCQVSPLGLKDDHLISIRQQTSEVLMEEQNSGEADPEITQPPSDQ
ncbi:uncharacterized protein LOC111484461 [Cucurbita maxima]|uniref:Uncharacterized protein LOC111484461 n=1 Tax=Cucurbita maxima TaxID=3661 RepID=A0A6J1JH80_CUCMA|nr:uncharacterized protein LOC111484461 [Cucurbita maxima]XP_022986842.1 uncharacterized protein LOC111484461 [Cucurbita maxima]XP_022986843.1 uncharacterized protein LOC111484461 [Cucurbita maxima]XP_022986844.1 uncharacterized protein LOC111484461 [Cucurbita maxima]XP_022986845.1 uncharacterized protein LOC111484461 [Cucurbita maxima]XP_022986846.1 uncharacterized protein LOC111484461 [Cucurbita maxima]